MGQPWGRLYTGTRHHRKIRILRQRCPDSWWIFYPLLEMAFETDNDGLIYIDPDIPFTLEELAGEVGTRVDVLEETLKVMADLRLISRENGFIRFLSYSDRQFKSDTSAERTRKYRERTSHKGTGDGDVTSQGCHGSNDVTSQKQPSDGVVTPPDTDTDTDTEKRYPPVISSDMTSPPGGGEGSPPLEKTKKKGPAKKADRKLPPFSPDFEAFWQAYPNKKGGKEEAWAIWGRRLKNGTLPPLSYLLECVNKLAQDPEWMEYAPMATTFLNKGRWSDVEGLKASPLAVRPATVNKADPNCPRCKGRGLVPVEKDGKKYTTVCPCRKIGHGTSTN